MQYDALGEFYQHESGPSWLEEFKFNKNKSCYEEARHLVTWSDWAKQSLIKDYSVPADKITVIPPGVNVSEWEAPETISNDDSAVKVLFVGGDLERKGGNDLIEAFRAIRNESPDIPLELHLVTKGNPAKIDGMFVYNNMTPNSSELKALYHQADIFCLPTYGDCLPMVLSEAAATQLPIISTAVAAIPEIVKDEEGGFVVPAGSVQDIKSALLALAQDHSKRKQMGEAAYHLTKKSV